MADTQRDHARELGVLSLAVIAPIWGYSWVVSKVALDSAQPFTFIALITTSGAACLFLVLLVTRRSLRPPPLGWTLLTGLLQTTLFNGLAIVALSAGGAGKVSVLAYTLKAGHSCQALDGRTVAVVDVVEAKGRERKMVKVDAAAMARAIATTGRIALYGILFDFDQATVKAESAPALTEIAALLTANPDLKLLVVGHTDMAGTFEYNRTLSQRRAEAVVAALVRDHDVDKARLLPVGVSFAAPLASNQTEEGRAQNRRVELVQY